MSVPPLLIVVPSNTTSPGTVPSALVDDVGVVARAPLHPVDACAAVQRVILSAANQRVIVVAAIERVGTRSAVERVGTEASIERIAAITAKQRVVAFIADQAVCAGTAGDEVLAAVAGAGDRACTGERQILDLSEADNRECAGRLNRISATACRFLNQVAGIDNVGVVPDAAGKRIVPGIALQRVGAIAAC